jgi:hypothetical protein
VVQGWSYGICYDSAEVRLAECAPGGFDACDPAGCPSIQCGDDYAHEVLGDGTVSDFHALTVHEDGLAQGVAFIGPSRFFLPPRDRFEMLRISFELVTPQAPLAFCDTPGGQPVDLAIVAAGLPHVPTRLEGVTLGPDIPFVRGDANADGRIGVADAVYVLQYIFTDGPAPSCQKAADANGEGSLNVADAIAILGYLFMGSRPLPAPFPACGFDPAEDSLRCYGFAPCE